MISIAQPILGPEEKEAVTKVLESGRLAQGPKVTELEENFAKACDTHFAVAANSGTAALHMAIQATGVSARDEVITVPFTFIATANTILMQNAHPVFVDIEPDTFNIDVSQVEAAITPQTKAILPVDLYGQPYDYAELKKIADKHRLIIIEDACQAVGAKYGNKKAGQLGDLGCFSLYATKNIMSGEGGIISTNSEDYVAKMKAFRQHGMMAMSGKYDYTELGYNYRMSDLHAAIAVEQLKKTDGFNKARQKNAQIYNEALDGITGIILPTVKRGRTHVYHQYTIRVTKDYGISRNKLIETLNENGVNVGIYYPKPLHAYKHIAALGYRIGDFPQSEKAADEVISLPVHPLVTKEDIKRISTVVRGASRG